MLNDYTGNRMSISSLNEFTESLDRVTLTCSLSHLHLVICDMSDLYDDPHYIVSHQFINDVFASHNAEYRDQRITNDVEEFRKTKMITHCLDMMKKNHESLLAITQ